MTSGSRWARLRSLVSIRALGLALGLIAALGVVGLGVAVEISSRPRFCGSCHIMTPYYESWKHSSHHNVECVDCHIPPGVTAEFRKKYEALSMVVKYFTGTYSTHPWAEVDDASCLRCHERRLLAGKEKFGDVTFDHTAHLNRSRRGTTLRCTSCHGQIVQGTHIAVTSSTCILCHFKGQTPNVGMARCGLCHDVPDKVIKKGTLTFKHADVARFGMDCTLCHGKPPGDEGAVPKERCVTCHNDAARLDLYGDKDLLHRTHVTEHKVDCMNCHLTLQHVGGDRAEPIGQRCDTCHEQGHSPQQNLYAGVGGRGVDPMPSAMFAAGVRCDGCHIALPGQRAEVHRASDVSCMSCHGPTYRDLLGRWQGAIAQRVDGLTRQIDETARSVPADPVGPLSDARFNLALVARGRGVHNMDYAYALLDRAHLDVNQARSSKGLPALPRPWPDLPSGSPCLRCHQGIEAQAGTMFGRGFRHDVHLTRAKLGCEACHRPHDERARGEVVRYDVAGCDSCHHQEPRPDCLNCHADVRKRKVQSFRGPFDHAFHIDEAETSCSDCHELAAGKPVVLVVDACKTCHKK